MLSGMLASGSSIPGWQFSLSMALIKAASPAVCLACFVFLHFFFKKTRPGRNQILATKPRAQSHRGGLAASFPPLPPLPKLAFENASVGPENECVDGKEDKRLVGDCTRVLWALQFSFIYLLNIKA